ncbi:MAG: hypothetical protein KGR26_03750 [Cyanobacteria bacterium REEB65]|nr:hypothetical protein [Cyanobacteria bacterium REEB65]
MALNLRAISLSVLAVSIVGCGTYTDGSSLNNTSPYSTAPNPIASGDPYNSSQYPTPGSPAPSTYPTPVPVPTLAAATDSSSTGTIANPAPDATDSVAPDPSVSQAPAVMPSLPPVSPTALRIVNVVPTKTLGLCDYIVPCWKAEIRSVSVQNPLFTISQSGRLVINFMLNGSIVEQPLSISLTIPPASTWTSSSPYEATVRSDTANAAVMTDGQ